MASSVDRKYNKRLRMSIKGIWRPHGSEVIIRWCQRSFYRRFTTRLRGFASQFCRPQREKTSGTRVPFPRGMHEKCKLSFLTDIDKCIKEHKIPPELVLMQSRLQVHTRL